MRDKEKEDTMRILLATDGSAPSVEARRMIIGAFDPVAVEVTVLTVAQPGPPMIPELGIPQPPDGHIMSEARSDAEREARALGEAGFAARVATAYGYPPVEIARFARETDQRLIVLGGRQRHLRGHLPLGSVSLNVWHHTPASVLLVHRAPEDTPKVLLAVDGSSMDRGAIEMTRAVLGRRCCVHVVSIAPEIAPAVLVTPGAIYPGGGTAFPAEIDKRDSVEDQGLLRADEYARRAADELRDAGFTCTSSAFIGAAAVDLPRRIETDAVDLAIVGTRGLGPIGRTMLGSVSEHVIRSAPATLVGRIPSEEA